MASISSVRACCRASYVESPSTHEGSKSFKYCSMASFSDLVCFSLFSNDMILSFKRCFSCSFNSTSLVLLAFSIEKARRTKEVELKEQEKQRLNDKIISLEKSEKHTKSEKEAMEQYLKDLEPSCVEGDSTYDARQQARTDEIDALKEAQVILADANNITVGTDSSQGGGAFLAQVHGHLRG